jgi:four helix bundle protein
VKIATGSAFEYETHVTLAQDVGLLEPDDATNLLAEISIVKRMLHGLAQSLR